MAKNKKYSMYRGNWVLGIKKIYPLCLNSSWLTMVDYTRGAYAQIGSLQAMLILSVKINTILVD